MRTVQTDPIFDSAQSCPSPPARCNLDCTPDRAQQQGDQRPASEQTPAGCAFFFCVAFSCALSSRVSRALERKTRKGCASTAGRGGEGMAVIAARRFGEMLPLVGVTAEATFLVAGPALVGGMALVATRRVAGHTVHQLGTDRTVAVLAFRRLDRVARVAVLADAVGWATIRDLLPNGLVAPITARPPSCVSHSPGLVGRVAIRAALVLRAAGKAVLRRVTRPT